MKHLFLLAPLALVACGPIPVHQAEQQCFERARLAQQPRGEIGVGMDSDGSALGNFKISVSSDYLMGRDPAAVYDICVQQKSGQAPTRPLYSFPQWKG